MISRAFLLAYLVGAAVAAPTYGAGSPAKGADFHLCAGSSISFEVTATAGGAGNKVAIDFERSNTVLPAGSKTSSGDGAVDNVSRTFEVALASSKHSGPGKDVVCFEAFESVASGEGATTSSVGGGQRCVNIFYYYRPAFMDPTPASGNVGEGACQYGPSCCASVTAYLAQETSFEVKANDNNNNDQVSVFVMNGLPNGATVGVSQCGTRSSGEGSVQKWCNPSSRQFKWTPTIGQEGFTYTVNFDARDDSTQCSAGGLYNTEGERACVKIHVVAPKPQWQDPTPAEGTVFTGHVGCTTKFCLAAGGAGQSANYLVNIGATADPGLPEHSVLAMEAREAVEGAGPAPAKACFSWTPRRGQEAFIYTTCFLAADEGGLRAVKRCVQVNVVRCKVCARTQDTILSIATEYDTDWLQVWGANVDVKNPDHLYNTQLINLCPTYYVTKQDTLDNLAVQMATTPAHIMSMNPDVESEDNIFVGQELCLCPGICSGASFEIKAEAAPQAAE